MPYISELLNNKISDSSDVYAGRLRDILITSTVGQFSPLKFLMVETRLKIIKYIPYDAVANFNSSLISLKNLFGTVALSDLPAGGPYVYLKKDVLDKQIVDVAGTRVVRVNDLRIGNFEDKMCVLGIDSSFRGLLRRLGMGDLLIAQPFKVNLIDWRHAKLLEGSAPLQLNLAAESLARLHPADLANIVEDLDIKKGSSLLTALDSTAAAKVLEEVDPQMQTILVKYLGPERASQILSHMSSDEFVDLIKTLSRGEVRELLSKMNGGKAKSVQKLINYPDNTAGGLMTLDYVSTYPDWNVSRTIEEIKKQSNSMRSIVFVYVVDKDGHFLGVVSLRRLLLAGSQETMGNLAKILPGNPYLYPQDGVRRIIKVMTKYNLYTAVVLDKERKLVGVVTIDDVMRQMFPAA